MEVCRGGAEGRLQVCAEKKRAWSSLSTGRYSACITAKLLQYFWTLLLQTLVGDAVNPGWLITKSTPRPTEKLALASPNLN